MFLSGKDQGFPRLPGGEIRCLIMHGMLCTSLRKFVSYHASILFVPLVSDHVVN